MALTKNQIRETWDKLASVVKGGHSTMEDYKVTSDGELTWETNTGYREILEFERSATIPYIEKISIEISIIHPVTIIFPDLLSIYRYTAVLEGSTLKAPKLASIHACIGVVQSSLEAPNLTYIESMNLIESVDVNLNALESSMDIYLNGVSKSFDSIIVSEIHASGATLLVNKLAVEGLKLINSLLSATELGNTKDIKKLVLAKGASLLLPEKYKEVINNLKPNVLDISEDSGIFYLEEE